MFETLTRFEKLITNHNPKLSVIYMKNNEFLPELFAIPWFLTLFAFSTG
jgi:hypothetical protein